MKRLISAIEGKEQWNSLNVPIRLIEEHRSEHTNIALDNAKSILESISKTILANKNLPFSHDEDFSALVKKAFKALPFIEDINNKDNECAMSIINSFGNIVKQIGTFRNQYGFFSHGRDLHSQTFDLYLTDLVIASSDVVSSFLISAHSRDLNNRGRIHYEDYALFNKFIDETTEDIPESRGIQMQPSRFLFSDEVVYRAELEEFNEIKNEMINIKLKDYLENSVNDFFDEFISFEEYFSDEEIISIFVLVMNKENIENKELLLFIQDLLIKNELSLNKTFLKQAKQFLADNGV